MLRVRGFTARIERDGEALTASASECEGVVTVWIENKSKSGQWETGLQRLLQRGCVGSCC
jgi:hypothetical protein